MGKIVIGKSACSEGFSLVFCRCRAFKEMLSHTRTQCYNFQIQRKMQLHRLLQLRLSTYTRNFSQYTRKNPFSPGGHGSLLSVRSTIVPSSQYGTHIQSRLPKLTHNIYKSIGTAFRTSIATGSLVFSSLEYTAAEKDNSENAQNQYINSPKWEEGQSKIFSWARKLWLPMLLLMTIAMGWQYPLSLTVNVLFLLLSTKPTPHSIYLWLEEWREQNYHDKFDWLKGGQLLHVEVQDYKVLCLAQVTSINQKLTMVGILGEWWILYSASSELKFTPFRFSFPFAMNS